LKPATSILITAGPTREPIDAVRFISNRSSGKMGLALAAAARAAGWRVTLLAGPGVPVEQAGKTLAGCSILHFNSTADLQQLLDAQFPVHDLLIMAAAVADYRPAAVAAGKLPRAAKKSLVLQLEPTPDLVAALARGKRKDQRIIAFALEEPDGLEERAVEKMRRKGVDAIVANSLSTMESESIAPLLLW
jgi:phosphopantothenoylcysteine decarboxylase / phosphopantothenate---cysteine ligase